MIIYLPTMYIFRFLLRSCAGARLAVFTSMLPLAQYAGDQDKLFFSFILFCKLLLVQKKGTKDVTGNVPLLACIQGVFYNRCDHSK